MFHGKLCAICLERAAKSGCARCELCLAAYKRQWADRHRERIQRIRNEERDPHARVMTMVKTRQFKARRFHPAKRA